MNHTLEQLESSLIGIRGSTVTPNLVGTVKVEYYGQMVPINFISSIGKNSAGIAIHAYETSHVGLINKALLAANFKSYVFSTTCVVVPIPPMSGDQRQETIKHLRKLGEDAKIAVRNLRKKYRQSLSKEELKLTDKALQTLTDKVVNDIDSVIEDRITKL